MINNINFEIKDLDVLDDDIKASIAHVILHSLKCNKCNKSTKENQVFRNELQKIIDNYYDIPYILIDIENIKSKLNQETFLKIIYCFNNYTNCRNTFFLDLDNETEILLREFKNKLLNILNTLKKVESEKLN